MSFIVTLIHQFIISKLQFFTKLIQSFSPANISVPTASRVRSQTARLRTHEASERSIAFIGLRILELTVVANIDICVPETEETVSHDTN